MRVDEGVEVCRLSARLEVHFAHVPPLRILLFLRTSLCLATRILLPVKSWLVNSGAWH